MAALSAPGTAWRTALWLVLGGWMGSFAAFGLLVTPVVFSQAPQAAGDVVGPVLTGLHLYGGAAGLVLALLAWWAGRGALLVAAPLLLGGVCLASHFGISTQIATLGDQAFGPAGSEALAARFNRLHRLSVALFVGVGIGTLGLVALHARADAREAGASGPSG